MRAIFLAYFLLMSASAQAATAPNVIVFERQCAGIDPAKSGFTCSLSRVGAGGMVLRWVERLESMPAGRQATAKYDMSRIIMEYHSMGGRKFEINSPHWTPGRKKMCVVRSPKSIECDVWKCDATGNNCQAVSN